MFTEETGTGFFSRLKNVFSSSDSDTRSEEVIDESPAPVVTISEEPVKQVEIVNEPSLPPYVSPYSPTESVTEKEISLRTVEVSAPSYTLPDEKDLDIHFATKFSQAGGKFIFCETVKEAVEVMKQLKEENNWSHIFCWENEIKDAFTNNNFQKGVLGFTIENSHAAVSLCENLVADEGTIILNPKQASRRRLTCFPKTHIILTDVAHLAGTEAGGLERFKQLHKGELPSIIKLGTCNTGHFYDKQRLILNAEGPEDIYVLLVDEVIPPSLRP
jgi:L-lactate dehydrogenase complex protein LldG